MKIDRRGVTRIVLVFRRHVVKIPNFRYQWDHFLRGILANISEHRTWTFNQLPDSYGYGKTHLLCPVKWCSWGGWILVMERAKTLDFEDRFQHDFSEHVSIFPGDDKIVNYGLLKGRLVKVDYGELDKPASEMIIMEKNEP